MKPVSRTWFASFVVLIGVAILIASYRWLDRSFSQGMEAAINHKSLKHSTGKVLSLSEIASEDTSKRARHEYRLCFSIESSLEIAEEERGEYQATMKEPFCENVQNPAAAELKPGDGLEIGYILENEAHVSVVSVVDSAQRRILGQP